MHHYGQREWYDKNWPLVQSLGEDLAAPHTWYNGAPPAVLPNAEVIGNPQCLTFGDSRQQAVPFSAYRNGFPVACYSPTVPLDPLWETASQGNLCSMQFFYATILLWLYQHQFAKIQAAFTLLLGPAAVTTCHEQGGLLPAIATVITPQFAIAVTNGTNNYQQLALQAFYSIRPPQNFGILSTNTQWYAAASWIHDTLLEDGANPSQPIFLCGHSYGGVATTIMAARYRAALPDRRISFLTFGDPKPGDQRLRNITARTTGVSLVNTDDLITVLPPNLLQISPVASFLGNAGLLVFARWIQEPFRSLMDANGSQTPNASPTIGYNTLLAYTLRALAGLPIATILQHDIITYRQRLLTHCPDPEWPLSQALWNLLQQVNSPFGAIDVGSTIVRAGLELGIGDPIPPIEPAGAVELGSTIVRAGLELGSDNSVKLSWLELGSTVPFAGLAIGAFIPPKLSWLELGSTVPFAGLELGTTDEIINCACCDSHSSPLQFTVRVDAPGYLVDGLEIQFTLTIDPGGGSCGWQADIDHGDYSLSMLIDADPIWAGQLRGLIIYQEPIGVHVYVWDTFDAHIFADPFTCSPWFFVFDAELREAYVGPTGNNLALTVISVP